jgi:AcrR family transcriptional regulator
MEEIAQAHPSALGSRDRQRLATRERVFRAALDEIRRKGLANGQVDRIVARCGVSRGTFYFHFPTKEDVLREWERRRQDEILRRLDRSQRARSLRGALLGIVGFLARLSDSPDGPLVLETLAIHVREGTDPRTYPLLDRIGSLLAAASESGELRDDLDAGVAATLFLSNVFGFLVSRTTSQPPHPDPDLLVDVFLTGVTASTPRPRAATAAGTRSESRRRR